MGKITQWQVWIIGVVLAIISAVVIYFLLMKPVIEQTATLESQRVTDQAEADKLGQYQDDLKLAKREVAQARADWSRYDRQLMPDINTKDRINAMRQLWQEQIKVLGPKVQKFLYADKNVRIVQANLQLAPPPTDPNTVASQKAITYDFGNITVAGTFQDILRHVQRWNKFDRLMLADGLVLSGNSPNLTGTYNLRAFVFLHADEVGPAIPSAGGGGGAGGGFGGPGFGGPPGGFGGPGGFSGPGVPGAPGGGIPGGGGRPLPGGGPPGDI